ncbi:hypothetical protein VTK26DRAFT_4520 [Humicola hyalothermophila]
MVGLGRRRMSNFMHGMRRLGNDILLGKSCNWQLWRSIFIWPFLFFSFRFGQDRVLLETTQREAYGRWGNGHRGRRKWLVCGWAHYTQPFSCACCYYYILCLAYIAIGWEKKRTAFALEAVWLSVSLLIQGAAFRSAAGHDGITTPSPICVYPFPEISDIKNIW